MTELRHRAKKDKRASLHEAQCRGCGRPYMTRGTGSQCTTCWRKHHAPKKKRQTTASR